MEALRLRSFFFHTFTKMRLSSFQLHATPNSYTLQQTQMFQLRTIAKVLSSRSQTPFQSSLQARQAEYQASERGQSHTTSYILLLRTLDGDARHSNESCCPPQNLRVTEELVPQRGVLWPCYSPDNVIEWAVLE